MRPTANSRQDAPTGKTWWSLVAGLAFLTLVGLYRATAPEDLASFMLVLLTSTLPLVLWIRRGGVGIPVLPPFALSHIFAFALPILGSGSASSEYSSGDRFRAAVTVALFLVSASAAAEWVVARRKKSTMQDSDLVTEKQIVTFVFLGLGVGVAFHLAVVSGTQAYLGSMFGLVRSVASTLLVVACYFLGVARARGLVRRARWFGAVAGLAVAILLSISSLFLVGGVTYALAAVLGFVVTSRKVPWRSLVVMLFIISILHAGKEEMRDRYWERGANFGGVSSATQVPGMMVEWFQSGATVLSQRVEGRSALDRTSLLQILLQAQLLTPRFVDFLWGESYALLPGMLVPRFLSPNKIASQASMDLLNVRYGLLSYEGASSTSVNWGLIAEAWANFGYYGQLLIGILVGLLAGVLTRWSSGSSAVSRTTLLAVATMLSLINGSDLAGLVTSLWQSFAAVLISFWLFRLVVSRRRSRGPESRFRLSQTGMRE